ncbi:hypothetical protein RIF25_14145 [Thermosynechococcaceae cyanobacterium BACA0444]|uniref:Peptide chain release factor 1 n=1 Tax=Pseudocalidococcus azoricus BACA0444 TaxID=2918990 RepID=A0AAE4K0G4_9CYAN|nr:hypothetical protein [Pseudocalidococcus azoricus]MDS3861942.1 hypothetical protein [Pseudocalidococcus azoricus BACA0444]
MFDPLRSLKFLPWRSLLSAAITTLTLAKIFDLGLMVVAGQSPEMRDFLQTVLTPPWGLLIVILLSVGLGALAVLFLETWFSPGRIVGATLWGLVLCLLLTLIVIAIISGLTRVPAGLLDVNENVLIGLAVGVFWRGRRYWRW